MNENKVRKFFERYERFFAASLAGDIAGGEIAALYAPEFIAASPLGVATGKNDKQLRRTMSAGYEYYRQIGTKKMRVRQIKISPIDEQHCVAHVAWTAIYAKADCPDIEIDFEVHYLMQQLDEQPQIFGWIAGDEQALLKARGVL